MNILLALVATLMVRGGLAGDQQPVPSLYQFCSSTPLVCEQMAQSAWDDACRLSGYSCAGVNWPRIRLVPLAEGLNGVYLGDGIVIVNGMIPMGWYAYAVMTHELTHYLQDVHQAPLSSCEREANAFDVTNAVLEERGRADLQRNDWRKVYGCE